MRAPASETEVVSYLIDGDARLLSVGGAWDPFARRNDASAIAGTSAIGQSLWRFVAGSETRYLYETLFEKVRARRAAVELPFRCDSPALRRFMALTVAPAAEAGDELELSASLLRVEPRVPEWILDARAVRGRHTLAMCSFCKRIHDAARGWLEVEEAVRGMNLLAEECMPSLNHGVCPGCRGRMREALAL